MSKAKATEISVAVLVCVLLIHTNDVNATTFTVGDGGGWGFDVGSWPKGKTFKAGDILVFNYPAVVHNVVGVGKNGYNTCNPNGGQVFSSGNDKITLVKGGNYFICGIPGHCAAGMKIAVTAT